MDISEAINTAAKHLPEGFEIIISIEKDGYDVRLKRADSISEPVDGGEGIVSDINEALCIAHGFVG